MKNDQVLLITGLSGGGKSTFLRSLEDLGYHCVDHLPIPLVSPLLENEAAERDRNNSKGVAVGVDLRTSLAVHEFAGLVASLKSRYRVAVVYVTADDGIVLRRYSETRRRHPMLTDKLKNLKSAIVAERDLMKPVRTIADFVIDTSHWSPHNLTRYVEMHFSPKGETRQLAVNLTSFGFKRGVARPVDCLFDVRFLLNPYFVPDLRDLTGQDAKVGKFIEKDPKWQPFFKVFLAYLETTIPYYYEEGKHYLHIAVGCTGGQHRSVYCVEQLAKELKKFKKAPISLSVEHRDLNLQK